jgi:hypothetical protein
MPDPELAELFSPAVVYDLTDVEIQRIAGENNESAAMRKRMTEKLQVMDVGPAIEVVQDNWLVY